MRNFIVCVLHGPPGGVYNQKVYRKKAECAVDAVGRLIVQKDWHEDFSRIEFEQYSHGVYYFAGTNTCGWIIPK